MNQVNIRSISFFGLILTIILISFTSLSASETKTAKAEEFSFVQVSDTHIGFNDSSINSDYQGTLEKVIASINNLSPQPDFIVFTGDLAHITDEAAERHARLERFAAISRQIKVKDIRYLPGEHDAALDSGEAFKAVLGKTYYSFEYKGVHFIAIDNVSDPASIVGDAQLKWLNKEVNKLDQNARVVILTHRPLFDLYPQWDWWTRNGADVRSVFKKFKDVMALYGHVHQLNAAKIDNITFYSARGTMYPLPAPGSVSKKAPVAWDAAAPYQGLGFRKIDVKTNPAEYVLTEYSVFGSEESASPAVIKITAKKFTFSPDQIVLKKGELTELDLTSLDVEHGFNCPDLGIRADIMPGEVTVIKVKPNKTGTFPFSCDVYCGAGHDDMSGTITVKE